MYQLLELFFILLLASGLVVLFWKTSLFFSVFHIILGFFFCAFFFLYALQHLRKYRGTFILQSSNQKKLSAWSGVIYLIIIIINIYSGLVLFFYNLDYLPTWSSVHLSSSFFILVAGLLHLLSRLKK